MSPPSKIEIIITGNNAGAITAANGVTTSLDALEKNTQKTFDALKAHWVAFAAAAAAALYTLRRAWDLADQAAAYQERKGSLNSLAAAYNTTADRIIDDIGRVSRGLIGWADSAQTAATGLAKGLNPDQIVNLAEAAERLTDITGEKVSVSFSNLTQAIALGRERALEASVGIIDLTTRYGDLVNKMSDVEKAQARYAIVMEKVVEIKKRLGKATDSTADKMERLSVVIGNLKLIAGDVLIRTAMVIVGTFREWASWALYAAGATMKVAAASGWLSDKVGITKGAFEQWNAVANNMFGAGGELRKTALADLASAFASTTSAAGQGLATMGDQAKKTAEDLKKAGEWATALRGILADIRLIGADELTRKLAEIGNKAKEMRAKFGPKGEITNWENEMKNWAWYESRLKASEEIQKQISAAELAKYERQADAQANAINQEQRLDDLRNSGNRNSLDHLQRTQERQRLLIENELELVRIKGVLADTSEKQEEYYAQYVELWKELNALGTYHLEEVSKKKLEISEKLLENQRNINDLKNQALMNAVRQGPGGNEVAGFIGAALAMEEDPRIEKLNEYYALKLELAQTAAEQELVIAQWQADEEAMIQQQKLQMASATFGMLASLAMAFYNASGQQSKAAFTAYKAFAIAQATIDTIKAAVGAYAAMASIPYVGPALGIAAAAAAIAFGMARVAQIASMQPGGGASVPRPSGGAGGAKNQKELPVEKAETAPVQRSQAVNVYIYGHVIDHDKFARETLPAIQKAIGDGA